MEAQSVVVHFVRRRPMTPARQTAESAAAEAIARCIVEANGFDAFPMANMLVLDIRDALLAERKAGAEEMREAAAKVADIWAKTEPNLERSDNPFTARAIAAIISDAGGKIATTIRALPVKP